MNQGPFTNVAEHVPGFFINRLSTSGFTIERLSREIRVPQLVLARLAEGHTVMRVEDAKAVETWLIGRRLQGAVVAWECEE